MFNRTTKTIVIASILALSTLATSVQAGEFRHHRGHGGNHLAIGAAGFLLGTIIGGTMRNPDGSTVSSHGFRHNPGVRYYQERDPRGVVIKSKIIRKHKKVKKPRKRRPVFASAYDPQTNIRTTSYRNAKGKRVVIRTRGPALPPQVR